MKLGLGILAGSALSTFGIVAFLGDEATPDMRLAIWLGMLAPLAAALCSMVFVNRAYRREPAALTRAMTETFIAKLVFFGGYVMLIMRSGWVQPTPFVISFVGYFFALHILEAFRLRRLVASA